jgi:hypothetical protein
MGRIMPFAPRFLPEYPTATEALDPAGSVLLLGLRWWGADMKQGHDPLVRLRQATDIAGAPDAAYSVDYLMGVVLRTARRPIQIGCPRCPRLSRDEQRLIHAAGLAQAGETSQAEGALRAGMLSRRPVPNSRSARWRALGNSWQAPALCSDVMRHQAKATCTAVR